MPDVAPAVWWMVAVAEQVLLYGGLLAGFRMWSLLPVMLGTAAAIALPHAVRWQSRLTSVTASRVARARRARAIFMASFLLVVVVVGMAAT